MCFRSFEAVRYTRMREEKTLSVNGRLPSKVKQPRVLGVEGIQLTPIPVVCTALTNLGIDVGKVMVSHKKNNLIQIILLKIQHFLENIQCSLVCNTLIRIRGNIITKEHNLLKFVLVIQTSIFPKLAPVDIRHNTYLTHTQLLNLLVHIVRV